MESFLVELGKYRQSYWRALLTLVGVGVTSFGLSLAPIPVVSGGFMHLGTAMIMYGGFVVGSVFDSQINADMEAINWNPFNGNENIVIKANKISFYKGVPTVWIDKDKGRSGSFMGIWLYGSNNADDIRHEWGHTIQQGIMGWAKYLITDRKISGRHMSALL